MIEQDKRKILETLMIYALLDVSIVLDNSRIIRIAVAFDGSPTNNSDPLVKPNSKSNTLVNLQCVQCESLIYLEESFEDDFLSVHAFVLCLSYKMSLDFR